MGRVEETPGEPASSHPPPTSSSDRFEPLHMAPGSARWDCPPITATAGGDTLLHQRTHERDNGRVLCLRRGGTRRSPAQRGRRGRAHPQRRRPRARTTRPPRRRGAWSPPSHGQGSRLPHGRKPRAHLALTRSVITQAAPETAARKKVPPTKRKRVRRRGGVSWAEAEGRLFLSLQ